jgi:hypothetical protein
MKLKTLVCLLAAVVAVRAEAGTLNATIPSLDIFGKAYKVDIYRVATDLAGFGPQLQPEGMTWFNGTLYVTGDAGAQAAPGSGTETNGYVAAYAGGTLTAAPAALGQFATGGRAIGPEAITINTRGSGYGSFTGSTPRLTVIDSAGGAVGRILAVLNPAGPAVEDIQSNFVNGDDIAYVPGATAAEDRFAVVEDGSPSPVINWYSTDATPTLLPGGFPLDVDAKGLVYLPQAEAALFSPLATTDCLMVSFGGAPNQLRLYKLDGTLLASSSLPTGTGSGLFGSVEGLAWDPVGKRLFLGDENAASSQIAIVTAVPEAASAAMLLTAAAALVVRRRSAAARA